VRKGVSPRNGDQVAREGRGNTFSVSKVVGFIIIICVGVIDAFPDEKINGTLLCCMVRHLCSG